MATAEVLYQKHGDQYYSSPSSRGQQTASITKLLTAGTIGSALLGLSGLTLTATVIALIMVTPVLVFFSPVLVPAAIVMFLSASGFVLSCGSGVAAIAALTWLYKYVTNYVAAKQRSQALGASFVQLGLI